MGRVRHPCPVVLVVWLVFVGGLGGIATIGAALRRVAGVSVVYGRKTPRGCSEGPGPRARGGVYGRKTPRVLAQSAVHLGDMRVTWGFWGVVDDGLGAVVGLMGEWWPVCAQAGPLGGGVDGLPGLPLVGLTCAVEGFVLPPDTPSDHLRCPGRQVRSGRPTGAELPPLPPLPASPEPRVGQDVSGNTRGPLACAPKADRGRKGPVSGLGRRGWASDAA